MPGSIELRGGFSTADPRLDRLPEFDERSRAFPIRALLPTRPLRSRSHPSVLWLDQGREGACVSFAFHHEAGATPKPVRGLTNAIARERYFEMQRQDDWPGGAYPGAAPFYEGTSTLAGAKVMQSLGYFKEYRWAFNIDEALLAVGYEGPVLSGIPWKDSMFDPRPDGTMDCSGRTAGGHEIMWRGVILPRKGVVKLQWPNMSGRVHSIKSDVPLIRLRNTWGKDWGIAGECLVRADDMESLLKDDGDCVVPISRQIP